MKERDREAQREEDRRRLNERSPQEQAEIDRDVQELLDFFYVEAGFQR